MRNLHDELAAPTRDESSADTPCYDASAPAERTRVTPTARWLDGGDLTWTPPARTREPRTILVGPARECQWPTWGHRQRPTHVYCAAPSLPDRSYCADHCARTYQRWSAAGRAEKVDKAA